MTEIKQPRGQNFGENFRDQPIVTELIFDWAKNLRQPRRVIDLAAGHAIEGNLLQYQISYRLNASQATYDSVKHYDTQSEFESGWNDLSQFKTLTLLQFQFPTSINGLFRQAIENGYDFKLLEDYDRDESLAAENRWTKNPGFVALLTKK